MPQLWTETFVSQYFWLIATFLTLYVFVYTVLIPNIAIAIKTRNNPVGELLSLDKVEEENAINSNIQASVKLSISSNTNLDDSTNAWLSLKPETDKTYWLQEEVASSEIENEYLEWENSWQAENNLSDLDESDLLEDK